MTDTTNPRAELDEALEAMRSLNGRAVHSAITAARATAACAEALSLLVDAHLPEPEPEPEPSRAEKAEAELRARELHHFEAEQSEAKAIAERDNAIAALRAVRYQLAVLAAGYVEEGEDARSAYRECLVVVEGAARRRNLDLGEEAP